MGDRTWLEIWIRKEDLEEWGEFTDFHSEPEESENGQWLCFFEDEVNYGFYQGAHEGRDRGLPFLASHGNGGEYSAGGYAFDGKDFFEFTGDGHAFAVAFDEKGNPKNLENMKAGVRLFHKMKRLVKAGVLEVLADQAAGEETDD